MSAFIDFFSSNFTIYFNITYCLMILFGVELLKSLLVYDENTNKYHFTFDKKGIIFEFKISKFVFITSIVMGIIVYYFETHFNGEDDLSEYRRIFRLFLTFCMTNTLYEFIAKLLFNKGKQILEMLNDADIKQKMIDIDSTSFINDVREDDKIYRKPKQQPKKQVVKRRIIEEKEEDVIEFEDDYEEVVVKRPVRRTKNSEVIKEIPRERTRKQQIIEIEDDYEDISKQPKKRQSNNRNKK